MAEALLRKANAVILTTKALEYVAVRRHLNALEEEIHNSGTIYEKGTFLSAQGRLTVVIVEVGKSGIDVAIETERAIDFYKPECVLCVGIANGIASVKVGDVVVASKIYHYDPAKEKAHILLLCPTSAIRAILLNNERWLKRESRTG